MKVPDRNLHELRGQGFTIVEAFLAPDELKAAQEALWLHYPRPEEYFADPSAHHEYARSQFDGLRTAPWQSWDLNRLAFHADLVDLAERFLGSADLHLYNAHLWAKYAGAIDYEQVHHRDFVNHSLIVPNRGDPGRQMTSFVLLSDVDEEDGPTKVVLVWHQAATKECVATLGHGERLDGARDARQGYSVVMDAPTHGTVEPGFEPVADSFVRGFEKGELGAAVSAYVDGRKVVDLWGGWADSQRTREWQRDTIACTYSATKGMTATCAHPLVDRGLLDVDEPVATYWPEFAQAGKEKVTVRMVLNHQAGRPRPRSRTSGRVMGDSDVPAAKRFDWETMTSAMAVGTPMWEPGTRSEYHGGEFGYLVGGVLQFIDGRRLGTYFREEIAEVLGADYLIDVGSEDDDRCADMTGPDEMVGGANTREWRAAGDGAATAFGTADGLARVYAALSRGGSLDGVQVLRKETIEAAVEEQPLANVAGGGIPGDFGLGYQLLWKVHPTLPVGSFGHTGMGGSIGLADPSTRLGFGYVMNQMGSNGAAHLLGAIYRSLAA